MSALRNPRALHRFAHGHAVGVGLREPRRFEVPGQRAGAQEHGLVPLAFLFREADDLDAERQRLPVARSSRTQAIGTRMPSRPSYLPPLRTVS
jgi:hypothetical protein